MTSATTARPRDRWEHRATDPALPLWIRVACYAEAHARPDGHCPMTAGQLHRELDPTLTRPAISRAIAACVRYGWLHPSSSARCLVLQPAGGHTCPAIHRGTL